MAERMSRAEMQSRIEQLEEAVAYLALDKKDRASVPPPMMLTRRGYRVGPYRRRS